MSERNSDTPRTDAIKYVQANNQNVAGIPSFQAHYSAAIDLCEKLESELVAAHEKIARTRGALGQASFCLRELLPDNNDAKLTVSLIDRALKC